MGRREKGNIADRVLELREQFNEVRSEKDSLEGEKKSIMKKWKDSFGVTTVKQAVLLLNKTIKERESLEEEIEDILEELEEMNVQ